jgi:hypothetical protein
MKDWQRKEKKDVRDFSAKPTLRSGGIWFSKGDLKNDRFLVDSKKSEHERFSITAKMWQKIYKEAILSQRLPLLSIEFGKDGTELVVLSKDDFLSLVDKNGEK